MSMFRKELLKAAEKSFKESKLTRFELMRIRAASFNPIKIARLEDVVREQIALEQGVDASAIDWEAIAKFLITIWPLILDLIERLG